MSGSFGKATDRASAMIINNDSNAASAVPAVHRIVRTSQLLPALVVWAAFVEFSDGEGLDDINMFVEQRCIIKICAAIALVNGRRHCCRSMGN